MGTTERRVYVHRIAILADREEDALYYLNQINRFCLKKGFFPQIRVYRDQKGFFGQLQEAEPTSVIIALPSVAGLNAAEHLRSLRLDCGIIWCSDLDFSLHAFRLRVEYFILKPAAEETFEQGLSVLFEEKVARRTGFK